MIGPSSLFAFNKNKVGIRAISMYMGMQLINAICKFGLPVKREQFYKGLVLSNKKKVVCKVDNMFRWRRQDCML